MAKMMKDYVSAKFQDKIVGLTKEKWKKYQNIKYQLGDLIWYQHEKNKKWFGPVKVVSQDSNYVYTMVQNICTYVPHNTIQ